MYEFTFLLSDETDVKAVKEIVELLKGTVEAQEKWGERTLAFPIKKKMSAKFFTWQIKLEANKLLELKKKLNFEEKILRYLVLKVDEKKNKVVKNLTDSTNPKN